jgi:hypothetical protein
MLRSHSAIVTHVKGLISLLDEYKKNLDASDTDGKLIYSAMFISTFSSGVSYFNLIWFFLSIRGKL